MTDLEKILSRLMKFPVKLIGIDIPQTVKFYTNDILPTFEFRMEVTPDFTNKIEKDEIIMDKCFTEEIPFCDKDCSECCNCYDSCDHDDDPCWGIPDVEYIIFNDPATIVFWSDGTKTVVKAMKGEKFEKYAGFAMACMKKMFGSTSRAKAIMADCDEDNLKSFNEQPSKPEPKKKEQKQKKFDIKELLSEFVAAIQEEKDEAPAE